MQSHRKIFLYSLITFIIINFCITVYFMWNASFELNELWGISFGEDATILISTKGEFTMPYSPLFPKILQMIRFLNIIIICLTLCYSLLQEWKKKTNIVYLLVVIYIIAVHNILIDIISPGIYDFFRKVHVAYYYGNSIPPALYYYFVFIVPVIIVIYMLCKKESKMILEDIGKQCMNT